MALTTKQKLFIEHYLESFNATQSAIQAGYSAKTAHNIGWQNVKKLDIQTAIRERVEIVAMSANERLVRLSQIARDTEQRTSDRLRAIELLGKLSGDYTEKIQQTGNETIEVSIRYSDENDGPGVYLPDNGRDPHLRQG